MSSFRETVADWIFVAGMYGLVACIACMMWLSEAATPFIPSPRKPVCGCCICHSKVDKCPCAKGGNCTCCACNKEQ